MKVTSTAIPRVSRMNAANVVTLVRIALVPVLAWALLAAGWDPVTSWSWRWLACGIFVLAASTDKVDGYLARSRGLITDLGVLLDPIADKALIGVAVVLLWLPLAELPWWVPTIILVRELSITVMRLILKRFIVLPAGRGGKAKTVSQTLAVGAFLLPIALWGSWATVIAWVLMAIALVLTVASGLDYAVKGFRLFAQHSA